MKLIRRTVTVFLLIAVLLASAAFYAVQIEPYRLVFKNHYIGPADVSRDITIVQVSDIQVSETYTEKNLEVLVNKINTKNPDIFLFTGDLYDNYAKYGPEEKVIELLSDIQAPLGKFAVYGNRDYGGGSSRRYEAIMNAAGFHVLKNEGITVSLPDDKKLFIGGMDDYLLGNPDIQPVLPDMAGDYSYRILLIHEPDTADSYADYGFDLILAGHSHGGQVRIPFMKGVTTAMARRYRSGFYQLSSQDNTKLYVNQGIGTSHYPVRFLVPPEITVFYLLSADSRAIPATDE